MKPAGKRSLVPFLVFAISAGLGLAGCWLSWGNPAGFHGTGFPFPVVVWDQGKDYVDFAALFLNPLAGVIAGLVLYFLVMSIRWLIRRALPARPLPETGE